MVQTAEWHQDHQGVGCRCGPKEQDDRAMRFDKALEIQVVQARSSSPEQGKEPVMKVVNGVERGMSGASAVCWGKGVRSGWLSQPSGMGVCAPGRM